MREMSRLTKENRMYARKEKEKALVDRISNRTKVSTWPRKPKNALQGFRALESAIAKQTLPVHKADLNPKPTT